MKTARFRKYIIAEKKISEIYRRYGVSSYKNIRTDQYGPVLKFLEEWRKEN